MQRRIRHRNFFNNRHSLFIIITSVLTICALTVLGIILSRRYIVSQAESRIQDVMLEAEAMHHYVQREMHPTMYQLKKEGRMPQEFYSPDILSSSFITRRVFKQYNSIRKQNGLPLVEYRMASINPRNKINKADSFEIKLIELFNNDSTIKKQSGIVTEHGDKHLYYAKPFLRIEKKCLKCHGNRDEAPQDLKNYYHWESGFNLHVGEIPAIEIIKTPLIAEMQTSTNFAVAILLIALVFLILFIQYSRLSYKNEIINSQKDEIEDTLAKLKETQSQLVESEKMASIGVLTAGVAHEINNPLNFILCGYMGLKKFNQLVPENNHKEISTLLSSIKEGVDRASRIVKGLNQFSNKNEKNNEICDVHSIIDNCLLMLQHKIEPNITIHKSFVSKPVKIIGNKGKLHQVFINIFTNAIQAIHLKGEINIVTKKVDGFVETRVTDTGEGIEKEHLNKVIEPFFTTKPPGEGTGLGLAITYSIIKELNGKLHLESQPNYGTTVQIKLPIQKA